MGSMPQFLNGREITFGADGRWWWVTEHRPDGLYGYPMSNQPSHHHSGHGHHAQHHLSGAGTRKIDRSGGGGNSPRYLAARPTPGVDDSWQGNDYARQLFQGQGANYFIGADHLVTVMAEVYTAAYTAAFFAPEIVASGQLLMSTSRIGILGNSVGRIFWSGGFMVAGLRAAALAVEESGTTLEMTPLGQWIDSVAPNAMWLWKLASAGFAWGAEGPVTSVQGDQIAIKSVWATIEYGILSGKNEIIVYSATGRW
jgi:hypothetical protein